MLRLVSRRVQAARQPLLRASVLTLALSSTFATSVFAQANSTEKSLPSVEVTGARFINDPVFSPIGATIITAEDIRNSGITNANEAVRKLGNVFGVNLTGTSDYALDLRGFGSTSSNNIVVLVDGVRLSENEQLTALLSTISIETIERIEIIRGGSSVLYGEGATGGVIQIVTKRPGENAGSGSIVAEVGSYNQRAVRAAASKSFGPIALDINYSKDRTDNYRRNNAVDQENFGGGIQVNTGSGRIGFRVDSARSAYRLPGALDFDQFNADPRQTNSPTNYASYDQDRYTLFGDHKIGNFLFAAEFSRRDKTADSFFGSPSATTRSTVDQFSPRVRHVAEFASLKNEFVVGMDLADWKIDRGYASAKQNNRAFYVRNETEFNKNLRVALGARHEKFKQNAIDTYDKTSSLNAWDAQVSYAVVPSVRLYAKAGQSYRIANIDDNSTPLSFGEILKPQLSHDVEVGSTWDNQKGTNVTVRVFEQRLTNEIMFDPTLGAWGANVNMDPTRRRGIEVEGKTQLNDAFSVSASIQHIQAIFRDGLNAGKDVMLVPKNIVSARVNWLSGIHTANVGAQWVDTQRFGDDFKNEGTKLVPSYFTIDARYAIRLSKWELAASVANLLDKKYYTNGYKWQTGSVYPGAGRTVKATARYDF